MGTSLPPPVGTPPLPAPMAPPPLPPPAGDFANNSGQGPGTPVPAELQGWSWAAFLMNWIWCIPHNAWLGLVVTLGGGLVGGILGHVHVPIPLALVGAIWCGVKGNEWAWQNRRWESIQQFRDTQSVWLKWGIALLIVGVVFAIVFAIIAVVVAGAAVHALSH
jgi:hypothetical protein